MLPESHESLIYVCNIWLFIEKLVISFGPHCHSPSIFMVKTAERQENRARSANKDFVRFFSPRKDLKYWFMTIKQMLKSALA